MPILIYRVKSCSYRFLVLGRRTYFYITDIFVYFSPSKNRTTIVRNEVYFCTSENTNTIALAIRKRLLKVWQVSRATPHQNRTRRNTATYICTRIFKIIFLFVKKYVSRRKNVLLRTKTSFWNSLYKYT